MHRPGPVRSELGFLSPVYPVAGFGHPADQEVNRGAVDGMHMAGESSTSASWERRCLRKHRRSLVDEGCSPKRRRLMEDVAWEGPAPKRWAGWAPRGDCPAPDPAPVLQLSASPTHSRRCPAPESSLAYPGAPAVPQPCPKPPGFRMELEAAQRRLQEIEERITLEDDDEDEDLDVEPTQSRPVLVMSESLREGLQQGFGDILPQNVAESVSHSCMELVLWRPPGEALSRRLKDSLEKQRKQATARQPLGPPPLPPPGPMRNPTPQVSPEEEMEL